MFVLENHWIDTAGISRVKHTPGKEQPFLIARTEVLYRDGRTEYWQGQEALEAWEELKPALAQLDSLYQNARLITQTK